MSVSSSAPPPPTLAQRTTRGAFWVFLQTLLGKITTLASQVVLARFLLKEEFGLYAVAMTVHSFSALLHQAGIIDVLIHRQRAFRLWANSAFWMSLATGVGAALITISISPLAAIYYRCDDPHRLVQLLAVMAIVFPINAAGAVSRARLQIDMRFRDLSMISTSVLVLDAAMKILFAWLGLGVFSFALSNVLVAIVQLVLCWQAAPVSFRTSIQWRRWKYLLNDGLMVVVASFFYWLINEGDYIVLGGFQSLDVVGLYFFAFKMSSNTITLLAFQISRVMFPALSQISQAGGGQIRAFVRGARIVAVLLVPGCVCLSLLADPIIRLFFTETWYGAIRLTQIMCLGMSLRTVGWPAASLLQAQGRFKTRMRLSVMAVAIFFPATIAGTWLGGVQGLAIAVAIFYSVLAIIDIGFAVRPGGQIIRDLREVFVTPLVASFFTALPAALAAFWMLPRTGLQGVWLSACQTFLIIGIGGMVYVALIRWFSPKLYADVKLRLHQLAPSRS